FHRGTIESEAHGPVFHAGELRIPLPGRFHDAGGEVELGIRPEDIVMGDGPGTVAANVEMVEPMGAETLVWVRAGGLSFSLRIEHKLKLRAGDSIALRMPVDAIHIFNTQTGA